MRNAAVKYKNSVEIVKVDEKRTLLPANSIIQPNPSPREEGNIDFISTLVVNIYAISISQERPVNFAHIRNEIKYR